MCFTTYQIWLQMTQREPSDASSSVEQFIWTTRLKDLSTPHLIIIDRTNLTLASRSALKLGDWILNQVTVFISFFVQTLRTLILHKRNSAGLSPLEYAAKYSGLRYLTMLFEEEDILKKTIAFLSKTNSWVRSNNFDSLASEKMSTTGIINTIIYMQNY